MFVIWLDSVISRLKRWRVSGLSAMSSRMNLRATSRSSSASFAQIDRSHPASSQHLHEPVALADLGALRQNRGSGRHLRSRDAAVGDTGRVGTGVAASVREEMNVSRSSSAAGARGGGGGALSAFPQAEQKTALAVLSAWQRAQRISRSRPSKLRQDCKFFSRRDYHKPPRRATRPRSASAAGWRACSGRHRDDAARTHEPAKARPRPGPSSRSPPSGSPRCWRR